MKFFKCNLLTIRKKIFLLKSLPLVIFFGFTLIWVNLKTDQTSGDDMLNGGLSFFENATQPLPFGLDVLKQLISDLNRKQRVVNQEKFGPLNSSDPIVVIQVHNRGQYLSSLIDSLRSAQGIQKSLVIFSHDVYDSSINGIVQQIDFCRVSILILTSWHITITIFYLLYLLQYIQIFYPYSLQLYPHEFPGTSVTDCPRDMSKAEWVYTWHNSFMILTGICFMSTRAEKIKCENYAYPDSYGHYREAKYTQTKHHWFWKVWINHVILCVDHSLKWCVSSDSRQILWWTDWELLKVIQVHSFFWKRIITSLQTSFTC